MIICNHGVIWPKSKIACPSAKKLHRASVNLFLYWTSVPKLVLYVLFLQELNGMTRQTTKLTQT